MYKINKRGQSTVEYVLLVAAVIAVMVAFTTNKNAGGLQSELNSTLSSATGQISTLGDRLSNAQAASNGASTPSNYIVNPTTQ
jgi:Flp pilus assembly pilin Flp